MISAKPVSLQELQDWVKANEHRTWYWPRLKKKKTLTLEIKYLNFSLDTRDMDLWRIWVDGSNREFDCSKHDEFEGTILELLEQKMNKL